MDRRAGRSKRTPAVMVQGAGSNVGKSMVVAGLARAFSRRGLAVRPFKPQNMSNNAAATPEGGEIGRAQALQALGAGVPSSVHMNPVLLKPETDTGAQIIVQGQRFGTMRAREYGKRKAELLPYVLDSFARMEAQAELVLIEGAGSPAEVNLRAGDIANMGFADAADVPVVIVGDIDRGGVIASLVGTHAVLDASERARIKAFLINKFRGDTSLFHDGLEIISARTDWASLGIIPYFPAAHKLPAEDVLDLRREAPTTSNDTDADQAASIHVVVPVLGRIANFDDLDPLKLEAGVRLTFAEPGSPLPRDADVILLPGSKSTVQDLEALKAEGWDIDLKAHVRQGGHVVGICGGYQILGRTVSDPEGIEGRPGTHAGLGLLPVDTVLTGEKVVRPISGTTVPGPFGGSEVAFEGYEIHLGRTTVDDGILPWVRFADGRPDGVIAGPGGRISGCYVHGLFANDALRGAYLDGIRPRVSAAPGIAYWDEVEATLELLADHLETHVDLDAIFEIACRR